MCRSHLEANANQTRGGQLDVNIARGGKVGGNLRFIEGREFVCVHQRHVGFSLNNVVYTVDNIDSMNASFLSYKTVNLNPGSERKMAT